MIATISIDDELFAKARQFTGLGESSAVIEQVLRAFVQMEARRRLARAGGTQSDAHAPPRRRP
ncbi:MULTISPECIES: type II toxin-antitoxin system VapB family antitoxin [unclassified Bradyrhizobium]|uniref:type II toxin-antitoxin system VapB family antitoxin n=1 Tax=unclassified Bradyrhizobium TaxID=2631580 RepID=UPI003391B82F